MGTAKQKFEGDSGQLRREYQKLQRENAKLLDQNSQLGKESEKTGRKAKKSAGQMTSGARQGVQQLASLAKGYLSVQAAVSLVNKAIAEQNRLSEQAKNAQVSVADSQAKVIKNLGNLPSAQKKSFLGKVAAIQKQVGFQYQSALNLAAAAGVSASAGNRPATLSALRSSARLSRDSPEELSTFVGGALDVGKASGLSDAEKNLSFLLSVGGQARIESPQLQAKNIAPAIGSIVGTVQGDKVQNTREAGALFAALSNVAVDAEGSSTKTSSISLATQLRDFFEKGTTTGRGKNKKTHKPASDPGTLAGRLGILQGDENLSEQFLDSASFERRFQVPIEQLVRGGETAKQFKSSLKQISFDPQLFRDTASQLETLTPQLRTAAGVRASEGNIQASLVDNTLKGRTAASRNALANTLEQTRPTSEPFAFVGEGFDKFLFDKKQRRSSVPGVAFTDDRDPETRAAAILRDRRTQIETGFFGGKSKLGPEDRESVKLLNKQITLLERSAAALEGNRNNGSAAAERGTHTEGR